MKSNWILRGAILASLAFVIPACGGEAASVRDGDVTEESTPLAATAHDGAIARHHPGGPELLLVAALHHLELTNAQRTTIEGALAKATQPPKGAPPSFSALADQVRSGRIDVASAVAKLAPPNDTEHRAAVVASLATLHDTLTADQRKALIAAIEEHAGKPGHDHAAPPPGDHAGPPPGGDHAMGPLGHFVHELDLSEAQRASIAQALSAAHPEMADHEAMKKHFEAFHAAMRARLDAFASDTFDAKVFAAPPPDAPDPKMHVEMMVKDLSIVVPILEPAQREKLASMIEKGPPMGPPPGFGPPPGPPRD